MDLFTKAIIYGCCVDIISPTSNYSCVPPSLPFKLLLLFNMIVAHILTHTRIHTHIYIQIKVNKYNLSNV